MTIMHYIDILEKNKINAGDHVKFLPKELQDEYNREIAAIGNVNEIQPPLINVSDVLRAYFILADYFTDPSSGQDIEPMLIGVKNRDLLVSAICRQTVSFGGHVKYTDKLDICATLFFGLVKNHAFHDGNKRVSLLILLYQLNRFGYFPSVSVRDFERLVIATAAGELNIKYRSQWGKFEKKDDPEVKTIAYLLRRMTEKKDHSYHITITMKEFCAALETHGVQCTIDGGKLHMQQTTKAGFWNTKKEINHSIPFGGWTRVLGAQTAREVLQIFGIYDQHPTYRSIMNGTDPLYKLVEEFERPLRRLKDE